MEIENLPKEKIKAELINKILNQFSYKVIEVDNNPQMKDFEGFHYKITIKNKETKKARSFYYSVGSGWNKEQREEKNIFLNLINSLFIDRIYTDKEEILGCYDDELEAERVYKNVCKNYDKTKIIELEDFFEELNETEKEIINGGF